MIFDDSESVNVLQFLQLSPNGHDKKTKASLNLMLPHPFDYDNDQVYIKQCFSLKETNTDDFEELETLNCNAEVICSKGYQDIQFNCVDVDECKIDHECTFE